MNDEERIITTGYREDEDDAELSLRPHSLAEYFGQDKLKQSLTVYMQAAIARLDNEQRKLATWGPKLDAWQDLQYNFREYQSLCKEKMMSAQLDMQGAVPVKFVVDRPIVADKKYFPKRSVIMIVSTFCVLALTLIVLLMIDKIEDKPAIKPEKAVD